MTTNNVPANPDLVWLENWLFNEVLKLEAAYGQNSKKDAMARPAEQRGEAFAVLTLHKSGQLGLYADGATLRQRPISDEERRFYREQRGCELVEVFRAPVFQPRGEPDVMHYMPEILAALKSTEHNVSLARAVETALSAHPQPAEPVKVPSEPLPVFSKGPWLFRETGEEFSGAELDAAAFAVYREAAPVAAQPSMPRYTSSIGHAGQAYLDKFKHSHPLPAGFCWADLWMDMCKAASHTPPSDGQDPS